jgi:hypothetical protein
MAIARVVDDDVQGAEMLMGALHRAERRLAVSHIESQREQRVAVLGSEVVQRRRITRRRGDAIPALQRGLRPLATKAARGTGDEPCLSHERPA